MSSTNSPNTSSSFLEATDMFEAYTVLSHEQVLEVAVDQGGTSGCQKPPATSDGTAT